MNLKEKMQELDDRVNKLDNRGLLTNGSFYVKETLQSLFKRVNAKDEQGTLSVPFSLLIALSNLEKRIEALENACKHNYTFDWVYTYIEDRQHEKIKRCSNCNKKYGETITEPCNKVTQYKYNNNQHHYSLSTCENCHGWLEQGKEEECVPKNVYIYEQLDGVNHIKKVECDICDGTMTKTLEPCTIVGDECTECHYKTHSHNYTDEITTSPTCETDGEKTWTCSCGDFYTEKIFALGHAWVTQEATCVSRETQYCENCGKPNPSFSGQGPLEHDYSGYCNDCGYNFCSRCGEGHADFCQNKN